MLVYYDLEISVVPLVDTCYINILPIVLMYRYYAYRYYAIIFSLVYNVVIL